MSARNTNSRRRSGSPSREPEWATWNDEALLDLRFCDLGVKIESSGELEQRVERLYEELAAREIRFRPHVWLSEEWFSPDGVPGIAIPFYLAHPRLARLERRLMLEVEGGDEGWCMKILRHEAGHTIDTAFRLCRRRRWREVFGKSSEPYPESYQPRPYSKSYVRHLDAWYAQSHPSEDFAETFAVWLKPRSRWRTQYVGWPALKKLQFVDALMNDLRGEKPKVASKEHIDPLRKLRKTLREHYAEKRDRYGIDLPNVFDGELRRLFSDDPAHARKPAASAFLRKIRPEVRRVVAQWTGQYRYVVDQVFSEVVERCRELNLRVDRPPDEVKRDALVLLTVLTMNHLHSGQHGVML